MFGSSDDEGSEPKENNGRLFDSDTESSDDEFSELDSKTEYCENHEIDQCQMDKTIWAESSVPKSAMPMKKPVETVKNILPRKYRRMKLKSHDEILEEQYDALKQLLDNKKNMSRKQLQEQHVSQTLNMIGTYRTMNKGARSRNIIISQSLPKMLRSSTPRSDHSSRSASRRGSRGRRCSSSRSPSLDLRAGSKRVTFQKSEHERTNSGEIVYERHDGINHSQTHNYLTNLPSPRSQKKHRSRSQSLTKGNETHIKVVEQSPRDRPGIYEDINGVKHSDSNLKHTTNPDMKRWVKQKEKLAKQEKKRNREKKLKEAELEAKKVEEQEKRRNESQKKLKAWQKAKRKDALLKRRQQKAQQKLESHLMQPQMKSRERPESARPTLSSNKDSNTSDIRKPSPPTMARPQSAPLKRPVKSQAIPLDTLIKNNPDLKEKLSNLEKQKKMKHRQSYDDWCRIKEKEKKDMLKVMREQRERLEREISEETARVISEAARRRMDGIRYKSTAKESEETSKEKATTETPSFPTPYSWRSAGNSDANRTGNNQGGEDQMRGGSNPVQEKGCRKKTNSTTRNVEDKINPGPANPFKDPFKAPKLRRPKSKLEQGGINGPDFAEFIWKEVNEEAGNRPEPQGEDSTTKAPPSKPEPKPTSKEKPPMSRSPVPPKRQAEGKENNEPIIETGQTIFSMTSVETA